MGGSVFFAQKSKGFSAREDFTPKLDPTLRFLLYKRGFWEASPLPWRVVSSLPPSPLMPSTILFSPSQKEQDHFWEENEPIPVVLQLSSEKGLQSLLSLPGVKIGAVAGSLVSAQMPLSALRKAVALDQVLYIERLPRFFPCLDVSGPLIQADKAQKEKGFTGKGVLIGLIDAGFDFRHPDFRTLEGKTRFVAIWDQTSTEGPPPQGFAYGREFTQEELNADLVSPPHLPLKDDDPDLGGHGTLVAGIAGGGDVRFRGIAPDAELIGVRFDFRNLPDAYRYLMDKAKVLGKPIVVLASYGSQFGPHDGSTLREQMIARLVGKDQPGRAIVMGAGNDGDLPIHISGTAGGNRPSVFSVITPNGQDFIVVDLFYRAGARLEVGVAVPVDPRGQRAIVAAAPGQSGVLTITEDVAPFSPYVGARVSIQQEIPYPPNPELNHVAIIIDLSDTEEKSQREFPWGISVRRVGGTDVGEFHAWLPSRGNQYFDFQGGRGEDFFGDTQMTLEEEATSPGVITVGSFISKKSWITAGKINYEDSELEGVEVGDASPFSARGPTRDGREKPEISAPGQWIAGPLSQDAEFLVQQSSNLLAEDGKHIHARGTSLAAAHLAGAIALLFQAKPQLNSEEIRQILVQTAQRDRFTGSEWNDQLGFGKLNILKVLEKVLPPLLVGDLNGNGKIDIADAVLALRIAIGSLVPSASQLQVADVAPKPGTEGRAFGDGKVTISDALRILRKAIGSISEWP